MSKRDVKRDGAIKRTVKKRNKRRRRRLLAFFFTFMLLAVCVVAVLSVTVLFPIKNIVVDGESVYSSEQVIKASEIESDDNIIIMSTEKVKQKISKNLPKSGEIVVKKQLPDTIKITVKTAVPTYFFLLDGTFYVANENFKNIDTSNERPIGCIQLKTEFFETQLGEKALNGEEGNELLHRLLTLCVDKQINVTGIDISDTVSIKLVIDDRLLVLLGVDLDTEYKIAHLAAMLPKMEEGAQGTIDLRNWSEDNTKASFRDEKIISLEFCTLN